MTLAGKYGIGVLSIGSLAGDGISSLATQWGFAEASAAKHGTVVDRSSWRVLMSWHLAETRERARAEARNGLQRWHNEYIVDTLRRPGAVRFDDPDEALESVCRGTITSATTQAAVVGTPDDLVAYIRHMQQLTGGFGVVVGFAHDWADREATLRSWELVARYVVPELNGYVAPLRDSMDFVRGNREPFDRAAQAVMAKIEADPAAAAAFARTAGRTAQAATPAPSGD